jgi:ABC-type long-subunit fatty acid transport system fused permease/ATPase subunit
MGRRKKEKNILLEEKIRLIGWDYRDYLKNAYNFNNSHAEEFINGKSSYFYKIFKEICQSKLILIQKDIKSAKDYAEVRYLLGQQAILEMNIDIINSIYLMVYPYRHDIIKIKVENINEKGEGE